MVGVAVPVIIRPQQFVVRIGVAGLRPAVTVTVQATQTVQGRVAPDVGAAVGGGRGRGVVTVPVGVAIGPLGDVEHECVTVVGPAVIVRVRAPEAVLCAGAMGHRAVVEAVADAIEVSVGKRVDSDDTVQSRIDVPELVARSYLKAHD